MGKIIDIKGQKFNRLYVQEYVGKNKRHNAMWRCICDCGNEIVAVSSDIRTGHTKSCGCYHIDKITKHGLRYSKLQGVHSSMIGRCHTPTNHSYVIYGGRGISVCDEWKDKDLGLVKFHEWAINNGYEEGLTLDRIDNNGNYSPENCRWVDYKVQNNNTRKTTRITINGIERTLSEWSDISGVHKNTILYRLSVGVEGDDLLRDANKKVFKNKSNVKSIDIL